MNFIDWQEGIADEIKKDSLWQMTAYRLALFASDLGWHDARRLEGDRRTTSLSDQLYRSLGSISANMAEGYSRGSDKERARFYEYALGSARESRDWYFKARHILGDPVYLHRLALLTRIIQLLHKRINDIRMIPQQCGHVLRERLKVYQTDPIDAPLHVSPELADLLQSVPLPDVLHPLGEPDL